VNFLGKFKNRIIIYAVIAVVAELSVYGIYMLTGDGYGLWFFILENQCHSVSENLHLGSLDILRNSRHVLVCHCHR
jgi:hypothetical protein